MIGRTELKLNEATVKAAIEHYLNALVFNSTSQVDVLTVVAVTTYGSASGAELTVTVSPKDPSVPDVAKAC